MTRAEYEKLKDFPKDKLIDIIKEEDRLIKVISECCVDANKDDNYWRGIHNIQSYLRRFYNPMNLRVREFAEELEYNT